MSRYRTASVLQRHCGNRGAGYGWRDRVQNSSRNHAPDECPRIAPGCPTARRRPSAEEVGQIAAAHARQGFQRGSCPETRRLFVQEPRNMTGRRKGRGVSSSPFVLCVSCVCETKLAYSRCQCAASASGNWERVTAPGDRLSIPIYPGWRRQQPS